MGSDSSQPAIIAGEVQANVVITPISDALRNETTGVGQVCSGTGASTTVSYDTRPGDRACTYYSLYNLSTWNRDRVADVVINISSSDPSFCTGIQKLPISPYGFLNASGLLWNDSQIVGNDISNSVHYPSLIDHFGGFNFSQPLDCDATADTRLMTGASVPFSFNYDNVNDFWTFGMPPTDDFDFSTNIQIPLITTREGTGGSRLEITERSFRTVQIDIVDSRFFAYDFEGNQILALNDTTMFDTPTLSNVQSVYDFIYDARNNVLKPVGALGSTQGAINLAEFDLNDDFNLEDVPCLLAAYSTDNQVNLNDPSDEFTTICFNLTAQHDDREFFGVWKMVNNTCPNAFGCAGEISGNQGRTIRAFLTMQSPSLFSVTFRSIAPILPTEGDDVLVNFISTHPAKGSVRFRYADFNANFSNASVFTSFFEVNNTGNLSDHFIAIPNVVVDQFYQFEVIGLDNDGNTARDDNNGTFFNFTVGGAGVFKTPGANETGILPEAFEDLAETTGLPFTTITYMWAFLLLIPAVLIGFKAGGFKLGMTAGVTGICCFALIGLLPFYLLVPFLFLGALVIALLVKKVMT